MHKEQDDAQFNSIDLAICEAGDILEVLAFIENEALPDTHQRLGHALLTLLYIAIGRLQIASAKLDAIRPAT